jgi:hypothetical protein
MYRSRAYFERRISDLLLYTTEIFSRNRRAEMERGQRLKSVGVFWTTSVRDERITDFKLKISEGGIGDAENSYRAARACPYKTNGGCKRGGGTTRL